jgi:2,3-dihydroxyphenylpropionate 1,2-dioxygenase
MQVAGFVAMSHSPSWDLSMDWSGPGADYVAAVRAARARVAEAKPDVMVVFGPDHCRNFFFDLMPPFCIGAEAVTGFGDFGAPKGPLPCASGLGRFIVRQVMDHGFDPALSLNMGVDHGLTQPYAALDPDLVTPLVPIMVNCAGEPLPSLRRCYDFGRAVGAAIRAYAGEGKALVVGSGGMSHSPPSVAPEDPKLSPETRDYVINGRPRAAAFNAAREKSSLDRRKAGGTGPVNADWDRWFLACLERGDLEPILSLSSEALLRDAGVGGQELRGWIAALGAWGGSVDSLAYEPVPTWITGMGCVSSFAPNT